MVCFDLVRMCVCATVPHTAVYFLISCSNGVWVGLCIIKRFVYSLLSLRCVFVAQDAGHI